MSQPFGTLGAFSVVLPNPFVNHAHFELLVVILKLTNFEIFKLGILDPIFFIIRLFQHNSSNIVQFGRLL
jgi:hypothetical protein